MGKKVLALSGSPRRGGNSDTLCDRFIKGAAEAGHEAEKIFLGDKSINYCTECGACNTEKGRCPQKDDMSEVLEKMVEADVIVMATPIYFYTMAGQMKTLIDRCCPRYTEISGKDFYFVMTAAETGKDIMDRTLAEFRGFTYCLDDASEKGVICGTGVWGIGEINNSPAIQEAYEMGKSV